MRQFFINRYFRYCERRGYEKGQRVTERMIKMFPLDARTYEARAISEKRKRWVATIIPSVISAAGIAFVCFLGYDILSDDNHDILSWQIIASIFVLATLIIGMVGEFFYGRGLFSANIDRHSSSARETISRTEDN